MLTNFALVSVAAAGRLARAVDYDCPNESWEPVIDSATGLQMIKVGFLRISIWLIIENPQ